MKFLKNRTVLGVVCIVLSLIICFAITPLFNASKSSTMKIVRVKSNLKIGQEITSKDIEVVEVGAYNMPSEVMKNSEDVIGKYASAEMIKGEYVLAAKISDTPASENAYLYNLTGKKRAISITIPSFAGGLSGKLISGDIVSVIAIDYKEKGETVVPEELQYVEVIAVTDKKGNDDETVTVKPDGEEETELPETVTLLVTPEQANILAELEAEGEIHVALVYRGTAENAQKFISAQEKHLTELAAENEKENENIGKPEVPEILSQSQITEENSGENNSEIDKVIINLENSSDTNSESVSENTSDNTETEVTSDANLFKSLISRGDDDEELDLEFDINSPESACFELPPDRRDNQVLAVWGSPSSGKTIMSVKLARYIASQKKNVILVLADMSAPPLPYVCPPSDLEAETSLGNILGAAHVDGNLIRQNAILHKKNEYLTMLAMLKGENAFSYAPYTETQARELLSELRKMCEYIIIDCTSNITNDTLSAVSLIESDAVLRLVSCDLKSISYLNSQLPLLLDNKFNANKQYKAASNVSSFQADDEIEQIVGGVSFKIPHSDEVYKQFLAGNLFAGLTEKGSKDFRKAVSKIANEVFEL